MESPTPRYSEVDLLRTLAVILMIIYHGAFDLSEFYGWDIDVSSGGWKLFARATAALFLLLVGISFAISAHRTPRAMHFWKYSRRGILLFIPALGISLITYLIDPTTFVRFGILHLIATILILLPFLLPLGQGNALIGIFLLASGPIVRSFDASTSLLLPLGITPPVFSTVDYFPLLPWMGFSSIGVALGQQWYVRSVEWRTILPQWFQSPPRFFTWPGRHALLCYLVHQPLLILMLTLILGWPEL